MKAMIHVPALGHSEHLGDPGYERRCLINDAERAAKMGSNPRTSCFWYEGSLHYELWMKIYFANVRAK